jgi:hypothetical protein
MATGTEEDGRAEGAYPVLFAAPRDLAHGTQA